MPTWPPRSYRLPAWLVVLALVLILGALAVRLSRDTTGASTG